jgi:exopolysaccharide production protein ExoQ
VPMWHGLLAMATNPLLGAGYESFWLGDRLTVLIARYGGLIQAHNGYLETYLNVGLVGLALLVGSILSGLRVIKSHMKVDYPFAMLRIAFVIVTAFYNWTEAAFYGVNNMWLVVFLGIIDAPALKAAARSLAPVPQSGIAAPETAAPEVIQDGGGGER